MKIYIMINFLILGTAYGEGDEGEIKEIAQVTAPHFTPPMATGTCAGDCCLIPVNLCCALYQSSCTAVSTKTKITPYEEGTVSLSSTQEKIERN